MVGRPTKYCDEIVQKARDYITNYKDHEHAMPSIVGMAIVLNISKSTLYDWADQEGNAFSDILDECMDNQELTLFNNALTNQFNASIAKLALGKHGYHDKADNTIAGPGGTPVQIAEVQRTIVDPKHTDS